MRKKGSVKWRMSKEEGVGKEEEEGRRDGQGKGGVRKG